MVRRMHRSVRPDRKTSQPTFTDAQRSTSDRYRLSSGRLDHSADSRLFRSSRLTSTFHPSSHLPSPVQPDPECPQRPSVRFRDGAPEAALSTLTPSLGSRHTSHFGRNPGEFALLEPEVLNFLGPPLCGLQTITDHACANWPTASPTHPVQHETPPSRDGLTGSTGQDGTPPSTASRPSQG